MFFVLVFFVCLFCFSMFCLWLPLSFASGSKTAAGAPDNTSAFQAERGDWECNRCPDSHSPELATVGRPPVREGLLWHTQGQGELEVPQGQAAFSVNRVGG